jgi:DNA repair protein NreA
MPGGKISYLNRLYDKYSKYNFRRQKYNKKVEGSSPPSVFIGRMNYPKVYVGPLVPEKHGDTEIFDMPEKWLAKTPDNVIDFRMQLIRGKEKLDVNDVDSRLANILREITLSKKSVEMEASFKKEPRGTFFNEETQPFGPSAPLEKMDADVGKFDQHMGKAHNDTDLLAREAVTTLYKKGVMVSSIQKAFSTGSFGSKRKLVPTRWSITAVDDTISLHLMEAIKTYPVIDTYQIYEYKIYNNYFLILLMPTQWQYEFLEAFIKVMGKEEVLFSDWEPFKGRSKYASIGGCYYSTRLALAEKLEKMKKQAGAIVFRESYPGYIPLGVWLVRECTRKALCGKPLEFENISSSLNYIASKLWLPMWRYRKTSVLLKQRRLSDYLGNSRLPAGGISP